MLYTVRFNDGTTSFPDAIDNILREVSNARSVAGDLAKKEIPGRLFSIEGSTPTEIKAKEIFAQMGYQESDYRIETPTAIVEISKLSSTEDCYVVTHK